MRKVVKVVFQCYFGHEIERVPSKFGDVRVPFVVWTGKFTRERGFFLVSHGKRFTVIFSDVAKHCKDILNLQIDIVKLT